MKTVHDRILERLLATTREGFWYIGNDTRTLDVNPAMCDILARPREQIIGRTIFEFVDEENKRVFESEIAARRKGKHGSYEISLQRPDGSNVACINNATPVFDDNGVRIASIGLWTDITELKEAQRQLLEAKDHAELASRAKSEFLSSMSHELRTPLHAILGFAELLSSDEAYPLHPEQRDQVTRILRSGDHLLNLINRVLDLEQIESGEASIALEDVPPGDVLSRCLDMAKSMAANRHISIEDRTAGRPLPPVRADATRLQQVLLNLLSNGIKYNRERGAVTLDCVPATGEMLRFSVADTGQGIAESSRADLFQPFRRLGMESGSTEGAGIGLTITRKLVELMHGSIGYDTEPGVGSTFYFELPLAATGQDKLTVPAGEPAPALASSKPAPSDRRLILYVEDNPDLLNLMEMIIAREPGLDLISAHNAEVGLVMASNKKPDLILLDINLPGMDGLEARRQLRNDPATARTPVVAVTGGAMHHNVREVMAGDFAGFLAKPFRVGDVLRLINECLQQISS